MNTLSQIPRVIAALTVTVCLVSTTPLPGQDEEPAEPEDYLTVETLPELPLGITSFGGAACDGQLYVWGGHDGAAHEYYRSGQNAVLYRLDLNGGQSWEAVHESKQGRQGLAMVAHGGKLYRLGGFEARNQRGEDQDLHSVAAFECFDPASGQWTELLPMPEARSSFDAVVLGDRLYVIGGWALAGEDNTVWSETAWSIDLADQTAEWEELPKPPFKRRALSVAGQGDKVYVIGGMQERGGPTRAVDVFNTLTGQWSAGPQLPGDQAMEGFGNSSFNVGGRICVTTYGGGVFRLNEAGDAWEPMGQLENGRFFHRLLPVADDRFALIGGANMESGKVTEVEIVRIDR
jgi:N-acetylneuraminic acid mutarotase